MLACALAGCGGSSSNAPSTGPTFTTVVYSFQGQAPTAVAVEIGAGSYSPATLQSGSLSISVPNGTTNYAIAYVCPQAAGLGDLITAEYVIEASTSDGNSFSTTCNEVSGNTGSATGSVDTSAIAGVANVLIRGSQGYGGSVPASGNFSVNLLSGSNDVAFVAVDSSGNVRAVKILRAQTVPGALNSGHTVSFQASDQTTAQTLNIENAPSGFATPAASVEYVTSGGTSFVLDGSATTQYPVVPASYVEDGDFYSFQANASDTGTHSTSVGAMQNSTGGGAATLSLPTPWSYTGPTPAVLPSFDFSYSGFAGSPAVAQQAEIEWIPSTNSLYTLTVTATANYQAGSNSITIPDLSSLGSFLSSASSGAEIYWAAGIWGGTTPVFDYLSAPPSSGSISFAQQSGTFTAP
ncbi:MAG: hypothetical protein WCF17_17805 [Terracidiphilus sp.]